MKTLKKVAESLARQSQYGLWAKQQAERNARRLRQAENQAYSNRLDIYSHGLTKDQLYNPDLRSQVVEKILGIVERGEAFHLSNTKAFIPRDKSGNHLLKASRIEVCRKI